MIDHINIKQNKQWITIVSEINRLENREVSIEELRRCATVPKESLLGDKSKELVITLTGYVKWRTWVKANLKVGRILTLKDDNENSLKFKRLDYYCDAFWLNDNIKLVLERENTFYVYRREGIDNMVITGKYLTIKLV